MKQFSLEEFKKNPNRKVVTRCGWPARVICTDKKGEYQVVALISDGDDREYLKMYKADGMCKRIKSPYDLFVEVETQEAWLNLHRDDMGFIMPGYLYDTEEQAMKEIRDKEHHVATIKISWEE